MTKTLRYIFIIVTTGLLVSCGQSTGKKQPVPSGKIIKIGVIGPMTGSSRAQGSDGLKGIQAAMSLKPLLANGDKIELVIKDDQDNPVLAVEALMDLVKEDNVSSILVLSSSEAMLEIDKEVDILKTPVLALVASHPDISRDSHYVHQICVDNELQGNVAALYARDELLISRAAVFVNESNPHSQSLAEIFTDKFKNAGGKITKRVAISHDLSNIRNILEELKKHDTELLYLPVNDKDFIKISRILADMDWQVTRMGSDGLVSTVLNQYSENLHLLEDVIGIDFYSSNVKLRSRGKSLRGAYKKLFTEKLSTYTPAGAEGYNILRNAMNKCEYPEDRMVINQRIGETVNFKGVISLITITPNGKAQRPLYVNTIRNGRLTFLVKVY